MHVYKILISSLFSLPSTLGYPNILPLHQQEIIKPSPGLEVNDGSHFQSTIRDVLLANQIIPQVLDDFEPKYYLHVTYPKSHKHPDQSVLLGNDIPVKAVKQRPNFTFQPLAGPPSYGDPPNEKNVTFTLILTDPDALSRDHPVKSEMCHWIVTNLTTPIGVDHQQELEVEWPEHVSVNEYSDLLLADELDLDDTKVETILKKKLPGELESYQPPTPPKKTGPHRYVFVLLEGDTSDLQPPKERPHWGYGKERHGVRDWAKENNLTAVGVNFFFAQHKKQ